MAGSGKTVLKIDKGVFSKKASMKLTSAQPKNAKRTLIGTAWTVASNQIWTQGVMLTLSYVPNLASGKNSGHREVLFENGNVEADRRHN